MLAFHVANPRHRQTLLTTNFIEFAVYYRHKFRSGSIIFAAAVIILWTRSGPAFRIPLAPCYLKACL
jgi:hypothetical protein